MTPSLDTVSVILVYSAIAVYALAFIAFTMDLARRAGEVRTVAAASVGTAASSGSGGTALLDREQIEAGDATASRGRLVWLRIGLSLTIIGFVVHLVATVLRGLAAERVPWANMYEFSLTATLIITAVFLGVQLRQDLRFLGTFIIGLVTVLLGLSTVGFYVSVVPLPPSLQSIWLIIHVFVASLGTAFLGLGAALSIMQLLQHRREGLPVESRFTRMRAFASLPDAEKLENLAYRLIIVGFVFWTFTLIAGAIWAEAAWGRYWGWDVKEVWTFVIWTIFAGYIHARSTRGWRGVPSAWLAIVGFSSVLFNYTVVNLFFNGLHSYSGLTE
ncbi:c-type cytochrome biogenesis protein CcsB [Arenivirga flava]|uniref:C-type cytochrome biogenesis protein CcsB n=1 Tax=Arenivirga flava TaxID=1930060 RepID=A0AA37UEX7_9MICO|nr:c-type cytochrome biogenesis protein CcsB [Arenivirga flava]GMA29208.1 c-type cytochrome biogenesis protein CcsB [Arenivirga flava]